MVIDFKHVKDRIHGYLDHGDLNELLPFNPTAENIAEWIVNEIDWCYKAVVKESYGNVAMAIDDEFPIDPKFLMWPNVTKQRYDMKKYRVNEIL